MLNIIKADLYKYFRRPCNYIISAIIIIASISIPIVFRIVDKSSATRINILNICQALMPYICYLSVLFSSTLLEEYTERTLKNTLSDNVSRVKYIIGKFIVQIIVGIIIFVISLAAFIVTLMFLNPGVGYTSSVLANFVLRTLSILPICAAGILIADFFAVITKSDILVYVFYFFLIVSVPPIINALAQNIWNGFYRVEDYLFFFALRPLTLPTATNNQMYFAIGLGFGYIVVFGITSIVIFCRQEIR